MANLNFMDPASKDTVLGVLQREIDAHFEMVSPASAWEAPTACAGWQVRDVVGHLVDTTEGYLPAFDIARNGGTAPDPHGLRVMAELVDQGAKEFRKVPQPELVGRLKADATTMMGEFQRLSSDDWSSLIVPHSFMPPLPAMFYPAFQLVDYAVHNWDIREGMGRPHAIDGDAADILAPLIFILWQATADTSSVKEPFSIGVRLSGQNAGDTKIDVTPGGLQYAPGDVSRCNAILEFDPATFVLTGYARMNAGTVRGDSAYVDTFRSLIFAI